MAFSPLVKLGFGKGAQLLIFKHFRPRTEKLPIFSDVALQRLTMPVLAIVGINDVLLDSAETKRRLESHMPGVDVRLLPQVGHLIRNQTKAILDFLRVAVD